VARHLVTSPEYARCGRLVVYAALDDELPLTHVIAHALEEGRPLLWPRVVEGARLTFSRIDRVESLVASRYGVREPPAGSATEALGPDVLVLVPGVAFDVLGARLGRGGGVWDRTLAAAPGAAVMGVGYELQVIERLPCEPHDVPLDALSTEAGIRRFARP
jgi:5-formyltetrahydrofolate cyclo-ligase